MPKLSVVVPFHNVGPYAPDTVRSLALNADPDFEFLLVDDCSTDETPDVLDRWKDRIPNARVIRHETNLGVAQARNTGIDASTGDYVTFLDGDDWYAPAKVRDAVMDPRDGIAPASMITMVDYPFVPFGVYGRTLFEDGASRFETTLRTAEDRLWVWRLHLKARTYAALSLHGVFYRRGVTTSLTQISDNRQLDFIPSYDLLLAEVSRDRDADRFLPKAVRTYCAMIAFHVNKAGKYEPEVAERLRADVADALRRMPQDVLEDTLATMDTPRATLLRSLRETGRTL